jgi:hypothetical protein
MNIEHQFLLRTKQLVGALSRAMGSRLTEYSVLESGKEAQIIARHSFTKEERKLIKPFAKIKYHPLPVSLKFQRSTLSIALRETQGEHHK